MNIRDFKDKYVFLKDVFNKIKKSIKVKPKNIKLNTKKLKNNLKIWLRENQNSYQKIQIILNLIGHKNK